MTKRKRPPQVRPVITFALWLCLAMTVRAEPQPGDVFREYVWKPGGNYHVLNATQSPILVSKDFDLAAATKAEVVLEIGNAHLGFDDLAIQLNGHDWRRIPFPELGPKQPSPAVYFHQWEPAIALPLTELNAGTNNQFLLRIGPLIPISKGTHPAYTCVYAAILRVYYDAAKKPHPTGRITSPGPGSALGEEVELGVDAASPNGAVTRVEFLGHYEDVNYEGDGLYSRWHGAFNQGRLVNHLGTADAPTNKIIWDTSWVPDQREPIQVAARIIDATGLTFFTEPVGGLKLERPGVSVELCRPYDVPQGFTACQYGVWVHQGSRAEKFTLGGDPARILDARLAMSCWNAPAFGGFTVNGMSLDEIKFTEGDGSHFFHTMPPRPLSACIRATRAGSNGEARRSRSSPGSGTR